MTYRILVDTRAARRLELLPIAIIQRIDKGILSLAANPRPVGVKPLRGELREGWRVRVGQYRILYRIDDDRREVRIFHIGHRREVYR